jgi:RNA polymerase sigma factor (sigma-70 family)
MHAPAPQQPCHRSGDLRPRVLIPRKSCARRRELGLRFPITTKELRSLVRQDNRGGALVLRKEGVGLPWKHPKGGSFIGADTSFFAYAKDVCRDGPMRWILTFPLPTKFDPPSPPAGVITEIEPWKIHEDGWVLVEMRPSAPAPRGVSIYGHRPLGDHLVVMSLTRWMVEVEPYWFESRWPEPDEPVAYVIEEKDVERLGGRVLDGTATRHPPSPPKRIPGIASRVNYCNSALGSDPEVVESLHFEPWPMCLHHRALAAGIRGDGFVMFTRGVYDFLVIRRRPWFVYWQPPWDHHHDLSVSVERVREFRARLAEWMSSVGGPREEQHEGWIVAIARKIARRWGVPPTRIISVGSKELVTANCLNDLIQEGWIGLIAAKQNYDSRTAPFKNYAAKFVAGAMWQFLRWNSSLLTVPKNYRDYQRYQESGAFPRIIHLDEEPETEEEASSLHEIVGGGTSHTRYGPRGARSYYPPEVPAEPSLVQILMDAGGIEKVEALARRLLRGRELDVLLLRLRFKVEQVASQLGIGLATVYRDLTSAATKIRDATRKCGEP